MRYINVLLLLLMALPISHAEVFKWTDKHGKTHFGDKPPADMKTEPIQLKIKTFSGISFADASIDIGKKKVVMYSTAWCGVCKKAKRYFKEKSIRYAEHDIDRSRSARARYKRLGGRGVPLILVGKKRMSGFSAAAFRKLYN